MRSIFLGLSLLILNLGISIASDRDIPTSPDPNGYYLFYLHGNFVEKAGPHKKYKYYDILDAFERAGLVVIGEARGITDRHAYATKIAAQVRSLIDRGVPPDRIAVAGHSKGGLIALIAAPEIANPKVRFIPIAACGLPGTQFQTSYKNFIGDTAKDMQGQFLVIWDDKDTVAGNCDQAMEKAGASYRNLVLETGEGHELFYHPASSWIMPVVEFLKSK